MARNPSGRKRHEHQSELVTVMLTLERPSPEQLTGYGRGEKYVALKSNARQIRTQLLQWIREKGLDEEVARVGEPTVFNTLFVTSTRLVSQELSRAPGVVEVRPADEFRVDLLAEEDALASGEIPDPD